MNQGFQIPETSGQVPLLIFYDHAERYAGCLDRLCRKRHGSQSFPDGLGGCQKSVIQLELCRCRLDGIHRLYILVTPDQQIDEQKTELPVSGIQPGSGLKRVTGPIQLVTVDGNRMI